MEASPQLFHWGGGGEGRALLRLNRACSGVPVPLATSSPSSLRGLPCPAQHRGTALRSRTGYITQLASFLFRVECQQKPEQTVVLGSWSSHACGGLGHLVGILEGILGASWGAPGGHLGGILGAFWEHISASGQVCRFCLCGRSHCPHLVRTKFLSCVHGNEVLGTSSSPPWFSARCSLAWLQEGREGCPHLGGLCLLWALWRQTAPDTGSVHE